MPVHCNINGNSERIGTAAHYLARGRCPRSASGFVSEPGANLEALQAPRPICRYPSGATIPDPNAVPDDRCTNQINYAGDPRSNAEINSIGAQTGQCPAPIS
ncbi:MAG: hypothetical protein EOO27_32780 [Comamonadaceae bacterium]|nr:MAG: hypothetical protein EOO27_32780 [Comamonadaceae bacterium]